MSIFISVNLHSAFFFFSFPACRESNGVSRLVSITNNVVYQAQKSEARGYSVFHKSKVLLRLKETFVFFKCLFPFSLKNNYECQSRNYTTPKKFNSK